MNDIATANYNYDNVSILLWNATSSNWDPQITKSVGDAPQSVFIGDANNDGHNDIVTANLDDNTVSILLGVPPTAPILYNILPNPDYDGIIELNWSVVVGASKYYVYRSTLKITSVDGLTPIVTVSDSNYIDTITTDGIYYYVVVAGNSIKNSSISNRDCVTVAIPIGTSDWVEQIPRSVGDYPRSVFIGDANNDGHNDIVTANYISFDVSILLWNDYYRDWDPPITRSVGGSPVSVFIGDANNDGYNDIVTANTGHENVSILLWNATSGNWDPQITRSVAASPRSVFIGDANNDGYNDIVTANLGSVNISILLWNVTIDNWDAQITRSVGAGPRSVFIGDANNDEYNDIVVANTNGNNISILLWNVTIDNWDAQITRSVGDAPISIFIGDANNDGYNDIATANLNSNNVSILLWNATSGNWNTQILKPTGNSPCSVFIGDANNDGYNDIATANEGSDKVSILLWNATSGNWNTQILKPTGNSPFSVFIGDANNDGYNDIVTANYYSSDVSILLWMQRLLDIDIVNQLFSIEEFKITFSVYNEADQAIDFATIQMWWDGTEVSTSVQNLGGGLYHVSLNPIFVKSGEDPILLNMTISALGYADKYFETPLALEPCDVLNLLFVEIIESSFSTEEFNLTFSVYNKTAHEIISATFQIWWDGTDVSSDIQNLGNGLYSISLTPITVAPGEEPILLKMVISASGYEDKHFETYLAVDPDTIEKGVEEGLPFVVIIAIIASIAGGGAAVIVTTTLLYRKRRKVIE